MEYSAFRKEIRSFTSLRSVGNDDEQNISFWQELRSCQFNLYIIAMIPAESVMLGAKGQSAQTTHTQQSARNLITNFIWNVMKISHLISNNTLTLVERAYAHSCKQVGGARMSLNPT